MSDNNISVGITAETVDLQAKMALAQSSLRGFTALTRALADQMRKGGDDIKSSLLSGLEQAAAAAAKSRAEIARLKDELGATSSGGFTKFAGEIEGLVASMQSFAGAAVVVAASVGMRKLYEGATDAAEGAAKLDLEVLKLSVTMGSTIHEAAVLDQELKLVGSTSEEYGAMVFKLERQIKSNEAAVNKMGLATRDAAGHLLPMTQVMEQAVKVIESYTKGQDRNQVSLYLVGRGAQQMFDIFRINEDVVAQANKDIADFGSTTAESIKQSEEFERASRSLGNSLSLIDTKIGHELQASLTDLAKAFRAELKPALEAIEPAIKVMIGSFDTLISSAVLAAQMVITPWVAARAFGDAIIDMFSVGPSKAMDNALAKYHETLQGFEDTNTAYKARMKALFAGEVFGPPMPEGGGKTAPDMSKDIAELERFRTKLAEVKAAMTEAGDRQVAILARETQMWRDEVNAVALTAKEKIEAERSYADAKVQLLHQEAADAAKSAAEETRARQEAFRQQMTLVKQSNETMLAQIKEANDGTREGEIRAEIAYWQERIRQAREGTLEIIQAQRGLATANVQLALQQQQAWTQAFNKIMQPFDQMLHGVLSGTQTMGQAFKNMWDQMALSAIESIGKTTIEYIAQSALQLAFGKTMAASQILMHAKSAAAAVYDDVAQIPYVGWILAPPAAAVAFAAVAAFGSFDQGTMGVPQTMMALVHQGEIIVPPGLSSAIRAGSASLGGPSSGGGTTLAPVLNLNISTNDARSFLAYLQNPIIARGIAQLAQRGLGMNPSSTL